MSGLFPDGYDICHQWLKSPGIPQGVGEGIAGGNRFYHIDEAFLEKAVGSALTSNFNEESSGTPLDIRLPSA